MPPTWCAQRHGLMVVPLQNTAHPYMQSHHSKASLTQECYQPWIKPVAKTIINPPIAHKHSLHCTVVLYTSAEAIIQYLMDSKLYTPQTNSTTGSGPAMALACTLHAKSTPWCSRKHVITINNLTEKQRQQGFAAPHELPACRKLT